jgi:hypothetical protein
MGIDLLKTIQLHDQSVKSVWVDFTERRVVIVFEIYSESDVEYEALYLIMKGVIAWDAESMLVCRDEPEVYDAEFTRENEFYCLNLVLLNGHGKASSRVRVVFSDFELQGRVKGHD